jgi:hypothetical protein
MFLNQLHNVHIFKNGATGDAFSIAFLELGEILDILQNNEFPNPFGFTGRECTDALFNENVDDF